MLARETFDGPHVWDKPGLSGYLVCLVHLVSLMQPNKPDRPNEQDRLADFFSILLGAGIFLLLRLFVGLHLDLLHGVLEAGPFCRSYHLKLKAELPPSAPPDNRCLNLNWGYVFYHRDPDLQSCSWLNVGVTFDATTPDG